MDKFLNLCGMCRRAGRLSAGHDASKASVRDGTAAVCVLAKDASERLREEMSGLCRADGREIPLLQTDHTVTELSRAIGTKAAVVTVNDEGFARKLITLYGEIAEKISERVDGE